ncbi:MAG: hypothetical protein KGH94_01375 [Candidatus Micrarchaeota archaeon]|nr:hypothetical protein [Candidatus Micrarchaeota archaeon]
MRMDIYGFKARVTNDGKQYIGVIPELHVHDQANSLRELESELKDAVDTAVSFMLNKRRKAAVKSPIIRSLIVRA